MPLQLGGLDSPTQSIAEASSSNSPPDPPLGVHPGVGKSRKQGSVATQGRLHRSGYTYPGVRHAHVETDQSPVKRVLFPAPEALASLAAMRKERATLVVERLLQVSSPIRHVVRRPFSSPSSGLAFQQRLQGENGRRQQKADAIQVANDLQT